MSLDLRGFEHTDFDPPSLTLMARSRFPCNTHHRSLVHCSLGYVQLICVVLRAGMLCSKDANERRVLREWLLTLSPQSHRRRQAEFSAITRRQGSGIYTVQSQSDVEVGLQLNMRNGVRTMSPFSHLFCQPFSWHLSPSSHHVRLHCQALIYIPIQYLFSK